MKLSKVDDKIKEFLEQHNYCHNSIPYGTVQYGTCCVLTLEFFYTQYSNSTFDESYVTLWYGIIVYREWTIDTKWYSTVQYGMVRYLLPYHVTFHDDRKHGIGAWFVFACYSGGEETHLVLIYFHLKTVIQQMNNNYDNMNHTATLEEMRIRFIELKELVYSNETITHYKK